MSTLSFPGLDELTDFFGCEPMIANVETPWFYNTLRYQVRRSTLLASIVIEPAEGIIDITMTAAGVEIAAARLTSFGEVKLHHDPTKATLSARFGVNDENIMWLTVHPTLRLGIESRSI